MFSSPPETRASLILRLPNAADVAAWDEFVLVYGPVLFRAARRQGLQPTDADDLVQEVFSAVAKQVGDWFQRDDRGRFRAWLLRIARNIAVNLLTRKPFGATGVGSDNSDCRLAVHSVLPSPGRATMLNRPPSHSTSRTESPAFAEPRSQCWPW
ncbi:MAG: sigma-70 family RNA polymerase sigma factor [Pirellulaceae bacterium]|nr:sigma-70 family RNA polymerase sigma factor [Pirellulaceae bacterium]